MLVWKKIKNRRRQGINSSLALPTAALSACLALFLSASGSAADDVDVFTFDDRPLSEPLEHPDWFKRSFLDLPHDLEEAVAAGKQGIMVYFGQRRCAYCYKLIEVNFGLADIVEYTRRHFDLIPVDIWGVDELTAMDGAVRTERDFALAKNTTFTPSILFYDRDGQEALRLRGFYPPYQFRAALEYVADGHYKRESFRDYLARGDGRMVFEPEDLNEEDFFTQPPFNLDRSRLAGKRPLAVFFEQGDCHACDVLHGEALREMAIYRDFEQLDNVQLDMWSDTKIITPAGERTTARKWAEDLGLFYAPSILFFDEKGEEILRVDSVVRFFRLRSVLNYLMSKAYLTEPSYQLWRVSHSDQGP
ncbi:MAG: thioredoxin fold domain-containing protein [Chromatiaceae bacterium]|nr:thioredoxin fold domain-containing protein [Chromatiaceae bacterium]